MGNLQIQLYSYFSSFLNVEYVIIVCFASIYSKTTTDVITELKQLDMSLREMVYKYDIQLEKINNELKIKVAEKAPKDRLMVLLRQRKILRNYLTQCENHMTACTQKQCSLEQLEITKMQLDAKKTQAKYSNGSQTDTQWKR